MTIRQIGEAETIKTEFTKVGETIYKRLQRLFHIFAGIPNYQLATTMNTSNQNLEPGWATYLKSAAFIVPGVFVWAGFMVLVLPKLKQICDASSTPLWKPIVTALAVSDFFRCNLMVIAVVILAALMLLEWRSDRWPRYRRLVFGILAYAFSILVLIFITTMAVFAVVAGANLLHGK